LSSGAISRPTAAAKFELGERCIVLRGNECLLLHAFERDLSRTHRKGRDAGPRRLQS
jgi:hypothetical protein